MFITQCKEIHATSLVRKVHTGKLWGLLLYASFPKFSISFETWILSLVTNTMSCFPRSYKLPLLILKKCLPNTQAWIIIICRLFIISSKNNVCGKQNNALPPAPRCLCSHLWNLNFIWQKRRRICDSVKNFKMGRLSWVIRAGPCIHKGPYEWKREAGDLKTLFCWLWT